MGIIQWQKSLFSSQFLIALLAAAPMLVVRNICEEFVWRGFLFSSLNKLRISNLQNDLAIGVIWTFWHYPFYKAYANLYHELAWYVYIPLFSMGTIITSVIYGELRRRSDTVWTSVILHTVANGFINTLILEKFISIEKDMAWLIAPTVDNVGYIAIMLVASVLFVKVISKK